MSQMKQSLMQSKILKNEKNIDSLGSDLTKIKTALLDSMGASTDEFKKIETQFKVLEDRIVEYKKDVKQFFNDEVAVTDDYLDRIEDKFNGLSSEYNKSVLLLNTKIQSSWILRKLFKVDKAGK